jgi:hypothetical protein
MNGAKIASTFKKDRFSSRKFFFPKSPKLFFHHVFHQHKKSKNVLFNNLGEINSGSNCQTLSYMNSY